MKLLHLGDLHLGKNLGDFDLKDDQGAIGTGFLVHFLTGPKNLCRTSQAVG